MDFEMGNGISAGSGELQSKQLTHIFNLQNIVISLSSASISTKKVLVLCTLFIT